MKKILAVVLCICMVVAVLGGCSSTGNTSSGTDASTGDNSGTGTEQTAAEKAIADRKAAGGEELVMAFFDWTGAPVGTDRIEGLINDITKEQLGITIDLQVMDATSFRQNVPLMCASGEKLDLFSAGGIGFMSAVNNGYLYNMNEDDLIKTYGSGIYDQIDEKYINACMVGDGLYAVPPGKDMAISACIYCIGAQYLDGIGYDYESKWEDENKESIPATWEDLEVIFAQLKEKYPDKSVMSSTVSYLGQGTLTDNIGGDYYGVLMDPANSLEVTDVWSSQDFMDWCKRFYRFNQAGYLPADCLTSAVGMGAQIGAGTAMSMMSQGKPGYRTQCSNEASMDLICFQIGSDIVKSAVPTGVCWGINQNCEDPVAAMQLLEFCYTDADVSNLLCWGEEGKDYVVTENGTIKYPDGVDSKNAEWNHAVQWQMPNELLSHVWYTDTPDLWDRMRTFNEEAAVSKALGFTWDNSEYSAQYIALQNLYEEYYKSLILGCVDPEVKIPEMNEKFKAVGIEEYIAAKTEALNAWAAEKGIS